MVKLTKIYTRTGDKGDTGLADGTRVPKYGPRVVAYGAVDEANAALGLCRLYATEELNAALARLQNDLFDVGADLATPERDDPPHQPLRVTAAQVQWLEREIDRLNAGLGTLRSFVLPAGTSLATHLHLARTVARRAEREVAALMAAEAVNPPILQYLNRLSDYLFVAARYANSGEGGDVLWEPGRNRE